MIGRTSTADALKERALSGKDLAAQLARDKKFRKQLVAAVRHGSAAKSRAKRSTGFGATVVRLASDGDLLHELRQMTGDLRHAWHRVEKKQSHKLRTTVLVVAAAGLAAWAAPRLRDLVAGEDTDDGSTPA